MAVNAELSNNITATSPVLIGGNPFYESKVGKLIGQRVVSSSGNAVRMEQSIIENGIIKGVGNVTNLQTWTDTFRSLQIGYGTGEGIATTADGQGATWTGYDIGKASSKGTIIYHGVTFFNTNPTGKLSFLNNLEGLHLTEVNGSMQTTMIWKWK